MKTYENMTFDEERALYGEQLIAILNCKFDGPADGESALKEASDIEVHNSFFNLRYPFWHNHILKIDGCELTEFCRAALWYSDEIQISDTRLHGIKALRECANVTISNCDIISPEFGWSTTGITMLDSKAVSEYFMMRASELCFENVTFQGKYSFQYIENAEFVNCNFDTKDAFWHGKNIVVKDSIVKGEYLAWYSEGLTLINCKIIGTQPFCYCKNLRLENCELLDADLCFEKSEVDATITTPVISIKNPLAGTIRVPAVQEIIMDDAGAKGQILTTKS